MTEQEIVEMFARLARARLVELMRLRIPHVYDATPGDAGSATAVEDKTVVLKLSRSFQPYGSIDRFVTEEKQMGFVINPGLLPLVKAITMEARGRRLLVTRRVADRAGESGVSAHLDGYGVR